MLQGGQIYIFALTNFHQPFFFFDLWKVKKALFSCESILDVHDDRRSVYQRLRSPQVRLRFLRKPKRRNTTCCCLIQAMAGYLSTAFIFFSPLSERRQQSGKAGRTNCGTNFYLLPASLQTVCFHWTWQLMIFAQSLLSAFQEYSKKCWVLSTRHDSL